MAEKGRREYGSGSIYRRKSDGLWIGTLDVGWSARGTRRRISVSGKTEAEVKRKLRDKRHTIEREGLAPTSTRATVKTWADQWLPIQERRLAPSSYVATRAAVTRWIMPTIGHKRLETLTPADVRAVREAQRTAGLSDSTRVRTHSVLMSLLKDAVREGYTVPQRVLMAEPPAAGVNDRRDLTLDHIARLMPRVLELPHGSRWIAALLQGLRQGEALGLTWDAVDLDNRTLEVSWQLQALRYRVPRDRASGFRVPDGYEARQLVGALHLVRPKSKAGYRVIPLVPWMATALERWRAIAPDSPHGLVWPNADGSPRHYKHDDAEWYALQDAAEIRHPKGRRYTVHEARHSTATLLHEAGVDTVTMEAILGHAKLVRSYVHVNQDKARAALDMIAGRLGLPG